MIPETHTTPAQQSWLSRTGQEIKALYTRKNSKPAAAATVASAMLGACSLAIAIDNCAEGDNLIAAIFALVVLPILVAGPIVRTAKMVSSKEDTTEIKPEALEEIEELSQRVAKPLLEAVPGLPGQDQTKQASKVALQVVVLIGGPEQYLKDKIASLSLPDAYATLEFVQTIARDEERLQNPEAWDRAISYLTAQIKHCQEIQI